MGLLGLIGAAKILKKGGTNKNDAKVAKYEYKTKKLESDKAKKEQKEKDRLAPVVAVSQYTFDNIDRIEKQLNQQTDQAKDLVASLEDSSLDKKSVSKNKKLIKEDLIYLYLAKDFFECIYKFEKGSPLSKKEIVFIVKFRPYFDGINVLDETEEFDDTIAGSFKEIGLVFKEMFVGDSNIFESHIEKYKESINKRIIVDVCPLIESFKKVKTETITFETEEKVVTSSPVCKHCGAALSPSDKFCPECGEKVIKKRYCPECGAEISNNQKLWPQCGHKL